MNINKHQLHKAFTSVLMVIAMVVGGYFVLTGGDQIYARDSFKMFLGQTVPFQDFNTLADTSVTLSDSRPTTTATHVIEFTHGNDLIGDDGDEIRVIFPDGFTGIATGNVTCPTNSTASTTEQTVICAVDAGQTLTSGTRTVTVSGVTNPSVGSYEFQIEVESDVDTPELGFTQVVIVEAALMTASVDTVFEFTVLGIDHGDVVVGSATTTATSTPTELPFEVIVPNIELFLGQSLVVATNASNGFIVTLEQLGPMSSGTGDDISVFQDNTPPASPATWASPGGTLDEPDEYGHYGLTSSDEELHIATGEDPADDFTGCAGFATRGCYVGNLNSPRNVFAHSGPVNGQVDGGSPSGDSEAHREWANIGIRMEITALQPAAPDYSTTLMYVATPTF